MIPENNKALPRQHKEKSSTVYPTAHPQAQAKMDLFDSKQSEQAPFTHPQPKTEQPADALFRHGKTGTGTPPANKEAEEPFLIKKEEKFPLTGQQLPRPESITGVKQEKKEGLQKSAIQNDANKEKEQPAESFSKEDLQKKGIIRIQKLKDLHQKYKSPAGLAELEKLPAFMRRGVALDDTPHSSETEISRFTLSEEENAEGEKRTEIKPNNPYLHDNVD